MPCHKAFKTLRSIQSAEDKGTVCDTCGGDTTKPTGEYYNPGEERALANMERGIYESERAREVE